MKCVVGILSSVKGKAELSSTLSELDDDKISKLLEFIMKWNTHSKHCYPAQVGSHLHLKKNQSSAIKSELNKFSSSNFRSVGSSLEKSCHKRCS